MYKTITAAFKSSMFLNSLKLADIAPLHKKDEKDLKEKYRPGSILPTLSEVFEKIMFAQISAFFGIFFLKIRKGYTTQHCLLTMLEKRKKVLTK